MAEIESSTGSTIDRLWFVISMIEQLLATGHAGQSSSLSATIAAQSIIASYFVCICIYQVPLPNMYHTKAGEWSLGTKLCNSSNNL